MGHGVGVANLNSAVSGDGAEQGADDALLLVVTADIGVADVEEDGRVELGHDARVARRHMQHGPPHRHGERRTGGREMAEPRATSVRPGGKELGRKGPLRWSRDP